MKHQFQIVQKEKNLNIANVQFTEITSKTNQGDTENTKIRFDFKLNWKPIGVCITPVLLHGSP